MLSLDGSMRMTIGKQFNKKTASTKSTINKNYINKPKSNKLRK